MTAEIFYEGNLRTQCTHLRSNVQITTDAPPDNNGKGEAFSPTDLVATALGSCMITLMGIYANNHGLNIDRIKARVLKVMAADPRRISEVHIEFDMPAGAYSVKERTALENVARTCPVAKSLHPDVKQEVTFNWSDQ